LTKANKFYQTEDVGPIITSEFATALQSVEALVQSRRPNHALFIEGGAGTGKSTLIRLLREKYRDAVIAAPTGIAATLLGGTTLHRLFNFPLKVLEPELDRENSYPSPVLRKMKLLIVDEVGMVRSDLIDGMDYYMRRAKRRETPFGGVAVLFVGDPMQLPPVVRSDDRVLLEEKLGYRSEHFFDGKVWNRFGLDRQVLSKVFRQEKQAFAEILGRVRHGAPTAEDLAAINARHGKRVPENTVVLTTTRRAAEQINTDALARLPGKLWTSEASATGDFRPEDAPADQTLALKPGCLVMLLNNTEDWQNGTTGVFEGMTPDRKVSIRTLAGGSLKVGRHTWERLRYRWDEQHGRIGQVRVGAFSQYPVRLAHGVTIHKAQGQTLDRAEVDLGAGAFAAGQTYVALSRLRSLEGLYLTRPITLNDCLVDARVREYFTQLQTEGPDHGQDLGRQMTLL
jgi:ATP-dependent DNA helicase PIF1